MDPKVILRQTTILLFFLVLTTCSYAQSFRGIPRAPESPRLAEMRAMLFYETNGKFSADVFTDKVNLWNTVIEGASREGASESMLVVVEINGESDFRTRPKRVELAARYRIADRSGRGIPAFFKKSLRINIGSDNKFFAAFWLYQTGCHPVELTAHIVGQNARLKRTINLGCGE